MTSEQVVAVAAVLIAIATMTLAAVVVTVALKTRRTNDRLSALMDRLQADLAPLIRHATSIADDVNYMTRSVRGDVRLINTTVTSANDRVRKAVSVTEQRLNEFNALLRVVQDEAEQLFVSTASTVRGVQTGAAELGQRGGMDLASDELDDANLADTEPEEGTDGDSSIAGPAEASAAPRIRPRPRGGSGRS